MLKGAEYNGSDDDVDYAVEAVEGENDNDDDDDGAA